MASSHSTVAYDHLLKLLLVGDAGTNKRALLANYIGDEDMSDTTTLGEDRLMYMVYTLVEVCRFGWGCGDEELKRRGERKEGVCVCVCVYVCACACERERERERE